MLPQYLHFIAVALISSLQKGQSFVVDGIYLWFFMDYISISSCIYLIGIHY